MLIPALLIPIGRLLVLLVVVLAGSSFGFHMQFLQSRHNGAGQQWPVEAVKETASSVLKVVLPGLDVDLRGVAVAVAVA